MQGKIILYCILSDDMYQELDSRFQNVGKASAIDIDLVRSGLLVYLFLKAKCDCNTSQMKVPSSSNSKFCFLSVGVHNIQ
jgi:hypothetical protein